MTRSTSTRLLLLASALSLAGALLVALTALFCHWAVNARSLGARDLGLGVSFAFVGATALMASIYAAPAFTLLAVVSFPFQRRAALRFLAAALASALPVVALAWFNEGSTSIL